MNLERQLLRDTAEGVAIHRYTATNAAGLRLEVMTYGATITAMEVPDRSGRIENVTLSLDTLADYLRGHPCLGSLCGRYTGRIANGRFSLDGVEHKLATNLGPHHIHGGVKGFDKVVWRAEPVEDKGFAGVAMSYVSHDGEEGYPGTLTAKVTYGLNDRNELTMEYSATTDKPTVVNLTNHAYWNLGGGRSGDVLRHELFIDADYCLESDERLIPTGKRQAVGGTPVDFTRPTEIGARIAEANGYDHSFVLNKQAGETGPALAARLSEPRSGRVMEVWTTEPGIVLYTANNLDGRHRSGGVALQKCFGVCLETEHFADSPNHPEFPSTVLRPGETYRQLTVHKFSVK